MIEEQLSVSGTNEDHTHLGCTSRVHTHTTYTPRHTSGISTCTRRQTQIQRTSRGQLVPNRPHLTAWWPLYTVASFQGTHQALPRHTSASQRLSRFSVSVPWRGQVGCVRAGEESGGREGELLDVAVRAGIDLRAVPRRPYVRIAPHALPTRPPTRSTAPRFVVVVRDVPDAYSCGSNYISELATLRTLFRELKCVGVFGRSKQRKHANKYAICN